MTAKKKTCRNTTQRTPKGRPTKATPTKVRPAQAPPPEQPLAAQATQMPTARTEESVPVATPVPAAEATTPQAEIPLGQTTPTKPLSALDAAARVLGESGQAMSCQELIAAVAAKDYWRSPRGLTPAGTLYSAMLRELHSKGEQSRFVKTERGKFALRGAV